MAFDHVLVRRKPFGEPHHGLLIGGHNVLECALGKGVTSVFKREGDGATPAHIAMRPQMIWFRNDRVQRPHSVLPICAISAKDGWCDAPDHAAYNEAVKLPFDASHEKMIRDDVLYDMCVVLDFNRAPSPKKRHGGSAIFLHCAKPGYKATAGCIALAYADLRWLLGHMDRHTRILVER